MTGPLIVRLPPAPPDTYLRWMAYWRELEGALHQHAAVAALAAAQGVPFFEDDVADYMSGVLATAVIDQAATARRLGAPLIAPQLEGPMELLGRVAEHVRRRVAWLNDCQVPDVFGIEPPDVEVLALRTAAMESFQRQAAASMPRATS